MRKLLSSLRRPAVIMGPGIASTLPASGPLELPSITKPDTVIGGLVEFFRDRQMLMREDFVRIVWQTQENSAKS